LIQVSPDRGRSAISTSVNRRRCPAPRCWHPNRREPSAGGSVSETVLGVSARFRVAPSSSLPPREAAAALCRGIARHRVLDATLLGTGAIFMATTAKDFYRSSNGDRWQLIRDIASGRSCVRHEPNLSSGGRTTDTDVEEFLNRTGSSPENLALRALLDEQSRMDGSQSERPTGRRTKPRRQLPA
jgi:hypothetical protein